MIKVASYFDINKGFSRNMEKMQEVQITAVAVYANLINDSTLLRTFIEAMHNCGLFEKSIDEWEDLNKTEKTWNKFQTRFLNAEEKYLIKKKIHGKNR